MTESVSSKKASLLYLFKTFLLIGVTSFGGYSALVSLVQAKLVEKDKLISDEDVASGFSLASVLPGPVAVNTVTYLGFILNGVAGAFISMFGVILPSFIIITILTFLYIEYGTIGEVRGFFQGIIPVVLAIIISVSFKMSIKNVISWRHGVILLVGLIIQYFLKGYLVYIICLLVSSFAGFIWFKRSSKKGTQKPLIKANFKSLILIGALFFLVVLLTSIYPVNAFTELFNVFSRVSLTLFGGGYVMIPILEDMIVNNQNWLSKTEFVDAIALGQVTPGPILISAAFVGYKVSGIFGAIVATVGIFGPSGILITLLANSVKKFENHKNWNAILEGIKPMVISFILYSIVIISGSLTNYLASGIIVLISIFLLLRYNMNYLYLILSFGILGILLL